jgi:hypothetical protein
MDADAAATAVSRYESPTMVTALPGGVAARVQGVSCGQAHTVA